MSNKKQFQPSFNCLQDSTSVFTGHVPSWWWNDSLLIKKPLISNSYQRLTSANGYHGHDHARTTTASTSAKSLPRKLGRRETKIQPWVHSLLYALPVKHGFCFFMNCLLTHKCVLQAIKECTGIDRMIKNKTVCVCVQVLIHIIIYYSNTHTCVCVHFWNKHVQVNTIHIKFCKPILICMYKQINISKWLLLRVVHEHTGQWWFNNHELSIVNKMVSVLLNID